MEPTTLKDIQSTARAARGNVLGRTSNNRWEIRVCPIHHRGRVGPVWTWGYSATLVGSLAGAEHRTSAGNVSELARAVRTYERKH